MPVPNVLKDSEWKTHGLPLRSAIKKVKKPKTGISEALRAYAQVVDLAIQEAPKKGKALRDLDHALTEAIKNHKGNVRMIAKLTEMQHVIPGEKQRLKNEIHRITLDEVFRNRGLYDSFHVFLTNQHSEENLDFLDAVNHHTSGDALYKWFIGSKALKRINIDSADVKDVLDRDHDNQQAIAKAAQHISNILKDGPVMSFRTALANQVG